MDQFLINVLNGISAGLLLFMLSSGLTLIFSMMGVLNFAHASFYMVGAYIGYTLSGLVGFWPALVLAPLAVGLLGAGFERTALRKVHKFGHVPELLVTFGMSYVILELVKLVWGLSSVPFAPTAMSHCANIHACSIALRWTCSKSRPRNFSPPKRRWIRRSRPRSSKRPGASIFSIAAAACTNTRSIPRLACAAGGWCVRSHVSVCIFQPAARHCRRRC